MKNKILDKYYEIRCKYDNNWFLVDEYRTLERAKRFLKIFKDSYKEAVIVKVVKQSVIEKYEEVVG